MTKRTDDLFPSHPGDRSYDVRGTKFSSLGDLDAILDGSTYKKVLGVVSGVTGIIGGGTGIASYTVGDILYASGTTTLSKATPTAVKQYLRFNGTAPAWQLIPGSEVYLDKITGATYSTVQDMHNVLHSAGWISGGTITAAAGATKLGEALFTGADGTSLVGYVSDSGFGTFGGIAGFFAIYSNAARPLWGSVRDNYSGTDITPTSDATGVSYAFTATKPVFTTGSAAIGIMPIRDTNVYEYNAKGFEFKITQTGANLVTYTIRTALGSSTWRNPVESITSLTNAAWTDGTTKRVILWLRVIAGTLYLTLATEDVAGTNHTVLGTWSWTGTNPYEYYWGVGYRRASVVGTNSGGDLWSLDTLQAYDGEYAGEGTPPGINVTAGTGRIRTSASHVATLDLFDWAAVTGLTAPAVSATKYVGVEYNAGSPQAVVRDTASWNYTTDFPLGSVYNNAGTLVITGTPHGLTVPGGARFESYVSVLGALSVTGAATLASTLGVTGAATLASTLGVAGASTFQSGVTVTYTDATLLIKGTGTSRALLQLQTETVDTSARPRIDVLDNNQLYICGDDHTTQTFYFSAAYSGTRTYGAQLYVVGPGTSWGSPNVRLYHDGSYGWVRSSVGSLYLDAPTGSNTRLAINGTTVLSVSTGSVTVTGSINAASFSTTAIGGAFLLRDQSNNAYTALSNTAADITMVNAPATKAVQLAVGGSAQFTVNTTDVTSNLPFKSRTYFYAYPLTTGGGYLYLDGYAGTPAVYLRASTGTASSKSAIGAYASLGVLQGQGWDGVGWYTGAAITFATYNATWSATDHGSNIYFAVTPAGSTALTTVWRIVGDGRFIPYTDNTFNFGDPSFRLKEFHAIGLRAMGDYTIVNPTGGSEVLPTNMSAGLIVHRDAGTIATLSSASIAAFISTAAAATNGYIHVVSGNLGAASLYFGDTDSYGGGGVLYTNADDTMTIRAGFQSVLTMTNALVESLKRFSVDAGVSITYGGGVVKADAKAMFVGFEDASTTGVPAGAYFYHEFTQGGSYFGAGLYQVTSLTATNAATTGEIYGAVYGVEHNGTQTLASGVSLVVSHGIMSSGSITKYYGVKIGDLYNYGTGTCGIYHALHISDATGGTTSYSIYTNAGLVRFGGKVLAVSGLVAQSAALATTATSGFLYVPTCAGVPTGVPATETGTAALAYDTTNNRLYVYNGAWKMVALA
jgi:hypothetical protein